MKKMKLYRGEIFTPIDVNGYSLEYNDKKKDIFIKYGDTIAKNLENKEYLIIERVNGKLDFRKILNGSNHLYQLVGNEYVIDLIEITYDSLSKEEKIRYKKSSINKNSKKLIKKLIK